MNRYVVFIGCMFLIRFVSAQVASDEELAVIGFYNVENLYDTLDDPFKNDDDFTPDGINRWTGERYRHKIRHLARVIDEMGTEFSSLGPAILGMCEVENISVVKDLVNDPLLQAQNYQVVHIEGPDARGVDPSFIYDPERFHLANAVSYRLVLADDTAHKTRDILVVSGKLGTTVLTVLVNHWPSRRGGELRSRENRNRAGKLARHIADSVTAADPNANVIIMGDLNDDPVNDCVKKYIGTYSEMSKARPDLYFNPMEELYKKGIGTLAYQDNWNLFDQIMLSYGLVKPASLKQWSFSGAYVNNKLYLKSDYGNFKGYPFRTYSGGTYTAGYSDHFASYIVLKRPK